jgi:poly(A) polymerase
MKINPLTFAGEGVRKVIEVLERHQPDSVRLVGGCVRDAIMDRRVNDIDFATPVHPEVVMDIFTKAGFHVEPTGIEHGTVTVIWDHEPYEITTLRRDVETDGRRAVVAFTEDWAEDAFRRDFTFNALYLAPDGTIHDYNGGIADAQNLRIRFMGDAEERIREDYLRILRMFRFQAVLGAGVDPAALEAAEKHRDGIDTLSGERLEKEVLKLLAGDNREATLDDMWDTGIFEKVFGIDIGFGAVQDNLRNQRAAKAMGFNVPPLAAVMAWRPKETEALFDRWKTGNDIRNLILNPIVAGPVDLNWNRTEARYQTHHAGKLELERRIFLTWITDPVEMEAVEKIKALVANVQSTPVFPLLGRHVLDLGVKPGRVVGEILRGAEERWVEADFPEDFETVHTMLREEVNCVV